MALGAASLLCVAIATPHLLRLQDANPATAASVWLLALMTRALLVAGGALFLLLYVPQIPILEAIADWCLHEILPAFSAHLGISAHPVVHVAVAAPVAGLAASFCWLVFGMAKAWIRLRNTLAGAVGDGPLGSTIVADDDIVVAVPTLGPSRILVSHRALDALDADELRASLEHERGHLERRHRPLILAAIVLSAIGRPLPGTRAAHQNFLFSLERDADEYAVRKTRDPLALASAICKALGATPSHASTGLSGAGRVNERLTCLLERPVPQSGRRIEFCARVLAALLAVVVLSLAASLPAWASGDPPAQHPPSPCSAQ